MKNFALILFSLSAVMFSMHAAQQAITVTNASALGAWVPVFLIAVMASIAITVVYYMIGYVLNNSRIKTNAVSEFGQAVGTVVIVLIILWIFYLVGKAGYSATGIVGPSNVMNICNYLRGTNVEFVSNNVIEAPGSSIAYATPTNTLCSYIISNELKGAGSATDNIDYGIASTYLVLANLTNQTASNINAVFMLDSYTYLLNKLTPQTMVCLPGPICSEHNPLAGGAQDDLEFFLVLKSSPFAGYTLFRGAGLGPIAVQSTLILYMSLLQMIAIIFFMYAWPYVLAAGIILRASFFTRRIGGLVIAITIAFFLIYPMLFLIEYAALSNTRSSPIGTNAIPALSLNGLEIAPTQEQICPASGSCYVDCQFVNECNGGIAPLLAQKENLQYKYVYEPTCGVNPSTFQKINSLPPDTSVCVPQAYSSYKPTYNKVVSYDTNSIDFYVFPRADWVMNYYSCWTGDMITTDLKTAGIYLVPGVGLYYQLIGTFGSSSISPVTVPSIPCTQTGIIDTVLAFQQIYGIMSVVGVILPVINILVTIACISGLSGLLGGDTNIFGISRLL
jgi:hypothetical protein